MAFGAKVACAWSGAGGVLSAVSSLTKITMKKILYLLIIPIIAVIAYAANEVVYKVNQTDKYRSSTLTFDVNSNIKNDAETKTWDFFTTRGNETVLRQTDLTNAPNLALTEPQWIDIPVLYAYSATGPAAPALTARLNNGAISCLAFDDTDVLYGIGQIPHSKAVTNAAFPNFYFEPHVHFDVNEAISGANTNVTFQLAYQIANVSGSFIATTGLVTATKGVTAPSVYEIASFGYITNNSADPTMVFQGQLKCVSGGTRDYLTGVGTSHHAVMLDGFDVHVPVGNLTGLGSRSVYSQ